MKPGARTKPFAAIVRSLAAAFKFPTSAILSPEIRTLTLRAGPPSPSSTEAPSINRVCAETEAASTTHAELATIRTANYFGCFAMIMSFTLA
jgi:hypothetical protein